MQTTHRPFAEAAGDFNRISRFIIAHNAHVRSHSTWCLGRFVDWKYGLWGGKLSMSDFWAENAHLWFDGFGELAGFARAVIQECLYRLRDMGLQRAYITGYSLEAVALYNSLGAKKRTESWIYKQTG
jgi:hypothetical protein